MADFVKPKGCKELVYHLIKGTQNFSATLFDGSGRMILDEKVKVETVFTVVDTAYGEDLWKNITVVYDTEEEANEVCELMDRDTEVIEVDQYTVYYKEKNFKLYSKLYYSLYSELKFRSPRHYYFDEICHQTYNDGGKKELFDFAFDPKAIVGDLRIGCLSDQTDQVKEIFEKYNNKFDLKNLTIVVVNYTKQEFDLSVFSDIKFNFDLIIKNNHVNHLQLLRLTSSVEMTNIKDICINSVFKDEKSMNNILSNVRTVEIGSVTAGHLYSLSRERKPEFPKVRKVKITGNIHMHKTDVDEVVSLFPEADIEALNYDYVPKEMTLKSNQLHKVKFYVPFCKTITVKDISFNKCNTRESTFKDLTLVFSKVEGYKSARSAYPESKKAKIN